MSNNIQRDINNMNLMPCPFCGGTNIKATFEMMSGSIKGIYCRDCTAFVKFNKLINANAGPVLWQNTWNQRWLG